MHQGIVDFVRATLPSPMVTGRRVLDVGSFDWNGSVRDFLIDMEPAEYLGIDILEGEGVDEVLSANDLLERYGPKRWDLIVCLEMLEHCEHWQDAVYQMKESLAEGGWMILTTRSPGYAHHAPPDHWRFSEEVIGEAFEDLAELTIWDDPGYSTKDFTDPIGFTVQGVFYFQPGVYMRGRRLGDVRVPTVKAMPAPRDSGRSEAITGF